MKLPISLLVCLLLGVSQAAAETPPNVLFLAVDDMNDWIGCLDATPRAVTPNLDRLAARGVCFSNAHTAGVFCAPSRAAIFSGQFASTTGCYRTANYFVDHPEIEPLRGVCILLGRRRSDEHPNRHGEHEPCSRFHEISVVSSHRARVSSVFRSSCIAQTI